MLLPLQGDILTSLYPGCYPGLRASALSGRIGHSNRILYTSLNELNQFDALRGQGGQQFVIMCLAFDPENQVRRVKEGEMRVGWLSSSYYWLVRLINKIEDAKGRGEAVWITIV